MPTDDQGLRNLELYPGGLSRATQGCDAVARTLRKISGQDVSAAARLMVDCLNAGNKIIACGNGGSMADAQHFVTELVVAFENRDRRSIPAVALGCNPAILTATANDFGYDEVFARELDAIANPGDVLLAITTSGRSRNVERVVELASEMTIETILLTSERVHQGSLAPVVVSADLVIWAPGASTAMIQLAHGFILHILADIIERECGIIETDEETD